MADELQNKLPKGSIAVAHIEKSGYSLLAGHYTYSAFFVVQITKADRTGRAKEYINWKGSTAPSKVGRFCTIYAFPDAFADKAVAAFEAQALDFTGYDTKADFKAALEAMT